MINVLIMLKTMGKSLVLNRVSEWAGGDVILNSMSIKSEQKTMERE